MLRKLADLMLGASARAGDLVLDADLALVMPVRGTCAAHSQAADHDAAGRGGNRAMGRQALTGRQPVVSQR